MTLRRWTFTVEPGEGNLRLDQLIAARTGLSRRQAREALKLGGVQVARSRVRVAGRIVPPGTEVRVAVDDALGSPPDLLIPILYEDPYLMVVHKPAGLPTQGTWATDRHDLLALLRAQRPDLHIFLHHRLDQGTSGVVVFGLGREANAGLTRAFEGREAEKLYLARVSEPLEACVAELPVGRVRHSVPGRFGCTGDLLDPRPARTEFRPAGAEEAAGLVSGHWVVASPRTGRTHQIRVHLAHLGSPVLGDALYGGEASDQLWLHAWKLRMPHPVLGTPMEWTAPPERFRTPEMGDA
ncbi:MAG: RluA family pseudouridine synthase [Acidobacteria bacterium]|nr:RluA family pseudouridine synthase [Acidobacteriota bacterium]